KGIKAKINSDLEKEINFKSKKLKLEDQIKELENNSDLKILQTILDELTQENIELKNLIHEKSKFIIELNKRIIFSRSKEKRDNELNKKIKKIEYDIIASKRSAKEFELINQQFQKR
ncbi:17330_t:CDS:1, partial [Racocetra persica]